MLHDDLVGPEGRLEGPYYGGSTGVVWRSENWQEGWQGYTFREERSCPAPKTSSAAPVFYWAENKKKRKERKCKLREEMEKRKKEVMDDDLTSFEVI